MPTPGQEESWAPDYETDLHIAYLKGSGQRIRKYGPVRRMRNQPDGAGQMAAHWTEAALAGPNGRTSKEMPWAKPKKAWPTITNQGEMNMNSTEYRALIERMGPKESIIDHIDNILDLLLPAGGDGFLHIGPGEWPHREELEAEVAEWIAERVAPQPGLDPIFQCDFREGRNEGRNLVRVQVRHLLRDHWLLRTYHAGINRWGGTEVVDGPAAFALVRIDGSGTRLLQWPEASPPPADAGSA